MGGVRREGGEECSTARVGAWPCSVYIVIVGSIYTFISCFFLALLQVCSAGSRLIVQESVAETMVDKLKERMSHIRVGA